MLNISQHSQENTFTGVSFLINVVAACNLSLSSEFFNNNSFKERKKALLLEKSIVIRNVDHISIANVTWALTTIDLPELSRRYQSTGTHDRLD